MYTTWKFLHVASMFGAATLFIGQGVLLEGIMRSGDVRAIRRGTAAQARTEKIAIGMMLGGIVFGVVTALVGELDLTQTWLLIAYGITAVLVVTGAAYHGPRDKKIAELAAASSENEPSEELRAMIANPTARVVTVVDTVLWLAIIYVMVTKPFS